MSPPVSHIGFHSLQVSSMGRGPGTQFSNDLKSIMMAEFALSMDVSFLFPYINAEINKAELHDNPPHIRFGFDDTLCVLYPEKVLATPFDDNVDARDFMIRFMAFLNDVYDRMDQITARHKVFSQTAVVQILKLLPQTNCNECGFKTCMAFAAMLGRQQTVPSRCPHICKPVEEKAIFPVHDKEGNLLSTIALDIDNTKSIDELDTAKAYIENLERKIEQLSGMKEDLSKAANLDLPTPLSKREIQVLRMLACGTTNIEIAHALHISPHTVKSHINHIFNKLGVGSRTQASVWATQNHFI